MVVTFGKEYLCELYEKGISTDKKHRYQPDIIRRYQKCINYLIVSPSIDVLRTINSLNYETLKGDKLGISSIRVNNKYRIEFTIRDSAEEPIVTICNILELSNHYK
ncbi:MAG: type II toxin-antitoxin system RelE/ParE family toxin [Coprobacter sp.]|nr:type II toxin-antitoxin system RelE/ParE family toxin [Coprobacter sp.]